MKAYPEYKPSGIDWLDKIPSHWDSMPLKYTVKNQETEFIDGNWIESPFITDTGVRYLTSGNVGPGFYKEQGNGFISDETFDELHCIEVLPGDLLISRLNEPIARTCEVPELGYKIVTCVDNVIYRPISDIFSRRFMMYQLNSEPFWFNVSGLSSGATMKRISRSKLGNIKVIVPPLKEQEVIAAYLDDVTGKVDALIAEKQTQVEDLRAYRNSIITETVTRGLNPDAPLRPSDIDWLGDIPEHWEITKLKYVSTVQTGSTPSTSVEAYWDKPVKNWFTPGDFITFRLSYSNRKVSEQAFNKGACRIFPKGSILLVGIGATLGKVGIVTVECSANQQVNAITFNDKIYPLYGAYFLSACHDALNSVSNASTLAILNQDQTKQFPIVIPPIDEQQAIAEFLDKKTEKIDALIDELSKQLDELAEYKKAVISEAVTGKVDVRNWTPNN